MVVNLETSSVEAGEASKQEGGGRARAPVAERQDGPTLSLTACCCSGPYPPLVLALVLVLVFVFVFTLALIFFSEKGQLGRGPARA